MSPSSHSWRTLRGPRAGSRSQSCLLHQQNMLPNTLWLRAWPPAMRKHCKCGSIYYMYSYPNLSLVSKEQPHHLTQFHISSNEIVSMFLVTKAYMQLQYSLMHMSYKYMTRCTVHTYPIVLFRIYCVCTVNYISYTRKLL